MNSSKLLRTFEAAAVLLFLLQAVRVLFSVLFGLIYDFIFDETLPFATLAVVMLCVIAAFLVPLVTPGPGHKRCRALLFGAALVAALARFPLTINALPVRLWSSIVIVGAAVMYVTLLLQGQPRVFPTALLVAFAADQFLRAAGNTFDVSLRGWWLWVQAGLSLATCVVGWFARLGSQAEPPAEAGIGLLGGLAIGELLFLETSLLGFPNALARWSGVDYAVVAPLLMAVTLLPALPAVRQVATRLLRGALGGLALLLLALVGLAAGRMMGGAVGLGGMLVAQFLLVLVPFGLARPRRLARWGTRLGLALGFLLFLLVNFAFAFTFTYAETIYAFRGLGLPVALIAVFVAALPALRPMPMELAAGSSRSGIWHWPAAAIVVVLTVAFAWPPALDLKAAGPIRVGTYNMHYGYNTPWQLSLEAQARTIEESGADIVMLQEVDTGRVTSYGVDDALWLARRLGMQAVYGPALEELSGIALLTRFPIAEADTALLTSHLEQTAIVHARVMVGDRPLHAYGVWLGLEPEERARQLDDALPYIGDASPAVFGGDFNATPDSSIYARIRAAGFDDPFIAGGFDPPPTDPAIDPIKRIDFVWVRGLAVRDARVLDSLASDHRMVVVELALP